MLELFKAGLILIGCQCFYRPSAGKKNSSESDSNDIVSLCRYRYDYGVNSAILII